MTDGLTFITDLIGYGVVKNATLKIAGKPHNFGYKSSRSFSDWVHGFTGTATPIASVGAPRTGDRRRSFSVTLRLDVDEWIRSQSNMAEIVRDAIDRAYEEHQNNSSQSRR